MLTFEEETLIQRWRRQAELEVSMSYGWHERLSANDLLFWSRWLAQITQARRVYLDEQAQAQP